MMIDRFGRERDERDFTLTYEDGKRIRMLGERRSDFGGHGGAASESYHSAYFRSGMPANGAEPPKKQRFTRGMSAGVTMSLLVFFYGLINNDVPVVFLAASFLAFALSPVIGALFPKGAAIENALKAFSVATFIGAIVMALF